MLNRCSRSRCKMQRGGTIQSGLGRRPHSASTTLSTIRWLVTIFIALLVVLYMCFVYSFMSTIGSNNNNYNKRIENSQSAVDSAANQRNVAQVSAVSSPNQKPPAQNSPRSYAEWRQLAMDLAALPASETLSKLERDDPFGVRRVAKAMEEAAAQGQPIDDVSTVEQLGLFTCPPQQERLSYPDQRDADKARSFRERDEKGTFIFFQHLRKAGGTNVCTMATANLLKQELPSYFCMPDYFWDKNNNNPENKKINGCAGCLHRWTNEEITSKMGNHRIAGNEWDSFDPTRHFDLPAVFVTSFRRPLDRAVSQFRFECLENRGCKFTEIDKWWEHRRDLYNVYTWTFSDQGRQARLVESTNKADIQARAKAVGLALDVIVKFHLVMCMEYLRFASPLVEQVLGFHDTSVLTKHVRPHNGQIKRKDSLIPKEFLSPEQYKRMSETLALDEILTDAAQRLFWERLLCKTY